MVRLANISSRKAVAAFQRFGYQAVRQTGSHIILKHQSRPTLTIPNHKELAPGLLRAVISQAGLDIADFIDNLKKK